MTFGPILTTKLYIPPTRPELVSRPRLIERLNEGLRQRDFGQSQGFARKLTLISAPAGFGKTTLVSSWIYDLQSAICDLETDVAGTNKIANPKSKIQDRVVWLSLDESDNDPALFLAYFVAALQKIAAGIGREIPGILQSPTVPIKSIMTVLINEIAALSDNIVLVLDDYHLITALPIHEGISFLLNHLPDNMHLIIATRADPPLPLARLRGRGQLVELRQGDLRFTSAEAVEFLKRITGLNLPADDIAALLSRTEGWIAGLQLAAVSMQGRSEITGFMQTFTGSNRYILDYLVEEVLQQQPERIQTFLLQTAILDRLNGSLCDAVLAQDAEEQGGEGAAEVKEQGDRGDFVTPVPLRPHSLTSGQEILEYLERANLFIMPLDDQREWYRYHRLFVDLLRKRLQLIRPNLVPKLHRRASKWYEQNEFMAAAIDHALSAEDFKRAAALVEQIAEAILMRSEVTTLLSWLEKLPDEQIHTRPNLSLYHASTLLLAGRPLESVEVRLQDIDEDTDQMRGKVAVLRASLAILQGQLPGVAELSRQALAQLPKADRVRDVAAWLMGVSIMAGDDLVAGPQFLDQVARTSRETGNVMVAVEALWFLAELRMRQGRLREAEAIYEQALTLATDKQGHLLPIAGEVLIGLGELSRERNNLEEATEHLTKGIELSRQGKTFATLPGYISLARVRQAQGDVDGAQDALQRAQQLTIKFDAAAWWHKPLVAMAQARFWIDQGNLKAAMNWAAERGLDAHSDLSELENAEAAVNRLRKYEYIVLARLLFAQKCYDDALALLASLLPKVEQLQRMRLVIEGQILKALIFQEQGDIEQAIIALEHALSLAEPEGYVRLFVDEGQPMARLLYHATTHNIVPDYTGKLLAIFPDFESTPTIQSKIQNPKSKIVEPLSERELEVLQLIAQGLSNREIAGQLVISLSTVKGHTANIYGKLGVNSRTQAVAQARGLDILPDL